MTATASWSQSGNCSRDFPWQFNFGLLSLHKIIHSCFRSVSILVMSCRWTTVVATPTSHLRTLYLWSCALRLILPKLGRRKAPNGFRSLCRIWTAKHRYSPDSGRMWRRLGFRSVSKNCKHYKFAYAVKRPILFRFVSKSSKRKLFFELSVQSEDTVLMGNIK